MGQIVSISLIGIRSRPFANAMKTTFRTLLLAETLLDRPTTPSSVAQRNYASHSIIGHPDAILQSVFPPMCGKKRFIRLERTLFREAP